MKVLGQAGEPTEVEGATGDTYPDRRRMSETFRHPSCQRRLLGMMQARVSGDQSLFRGETIAALQARIFPAIDAQLDDKDWQTALWVLHAGVNLAILSRALYGRCFILWPLRPGARMLLYHRCRCGFSRCRDQSGQRLP